MEYYEDQFAQKYDFPVRTQVNKVLVIASTVRCGSHMLGHVLHETGAFGFPLEYTQKNNLKRWQQILGTGNLADTLNALQQRRTSPNGVFAIKVHYSHLQQFGGFNQLLKQFPDAYFVLLTRKDVLAQAVSLSIAKQTGSWIAKQGQGDKSLTYNARTIDEGLRRILFENASWRYTLAASGANYLEMSFDEVKRDTPTAVMRIAGFMDLDVDVSRIPPAPVTQKQQKPVNQEWIKRFQQSFNSDNELMRYNRQSLWRRLTKKFFKTTTAPEAGR